MSPRSPTAPQSLDPPGPEGIASRLFPPLPTEAEWRLVRVDDALDALGRPHRDFRSLLAGGTNGKGTVVAVWEAVLGQAGRRVGRYTSPHLLRFNERFRIDGAPATDDELLAAAAPIRDVATAHGLTFFEAVTVLAFRLFSLREVEVAAVEVGLGGRLDATNVLRPEVSVVTNVALDHTAWLGSTREEVAVEKAGIARKGAPLITAEADPRIVEVLRAGTEERGGRFHHLDPTPILQGRVRDDGESRFVLETDHWGSLELSTALRGRHQVANVALAVRALDLLDDSLRPDADAVRAGVRRARWPGRVQVVRSGGRTWILDVAHNPAAVGALVATLDEIEPPGPRVVVFACYADKDRRGMLDQLVPGARALVLTSVPGAPPGRSWDPEVAAREVEDGDGPGQGADPAPTILVEPDPRRALARGREEAGNGGVIVVTGAHLLVGTALAELGIGLPDAP